MPFIAGLICLSNAIQDEQRKRFEKALSNIFRDIPWPAEKIESNKYVMVTADYQEMWQGPKALSTPEYDVIGTGVQWRKIPSSNSALEYLAEQFLHKHDKITNYFDYFSCIIIDKKTDRCILATDPLGISQLVYYIDDAILVFSSHQTFIRSYLKSDNIGVCWDAVFEYLLIQHLLGNKTLIEGAKLLPPGNILELKGRNYSLIPYYNLNGIKDPIDK